jgi:hypothetical protein
VCSFSLPLFAVVSEQPPSNLFFFLLLHHHLLLLLCLACLWLYRTRQRQQQQPKRAATRESSSLLKKQVVQREHCRQKDCFSPCLPSLIFFSSISCCCSILSSRADVWKRANPIKHIYFFIRINPHLRGYIFFELKKSPITAIVGED